MENIHALRLKLLRENMEKNGINYWYIPTADYHNSEYAADYFKDREYFSGFDGSNGSLLVGREKAGLWTDGRYWVQAREQIEGSGIELFKMFQPGAPTVIQYLKKNMKPGEVLCFDGRRVTKEEGEIFERTASGAGGSLRTDLDPSDGIWRERPMRPCEDLYILPLEYAGKTFAEKKQCILDALKKNRADYYFSAKLDDLMWLANLRGDDIACNPVALSYGLFSAKRNVLFLQKAALTPEITGYLRENRIETEDYDQIFTYLKSTDLSGRILYDPANCSYEAYTALSSGAGSRVMVPDDSPVELAKSVKNQTEIKNIRDIYIEDSAAVFKLIYWLKNEADIENCTELDVSDQLESYRRQIGDFIELSFDTIAAYGPNAAMMHYEPSENNSARLHREGMLLVDSGGTYFRGTTDVTRTTALGPVTEEMRRMYSLTAAGNLRLQNAVFLEGCTGRNLDILARGPLWDIGSDYKCGTGHGIGFVLNVHEGPQSIRWRNSKGSDRTEFRPGMIVSDEPGVYRDGEYGIRIETILLCTEKTVTADGSFFGFEPITFVPFDRDLLSAEYLTDREVGWVNEYHALCLQKLSPYLNEREKAYLADLCRPMV